MGWTSRKCMVKDCQKIRDDKTWYDDTYWEENPFLCFEEHNYDNAKITKDDVKKWEEQGNRDIYKPEFPKDRLNFPGDYL